MFNGKIQYRIVKKDYFDDATILVPDMQSDNSEDESPHADTIILEESATNIIDEQEENVSVLIDKKFSSVIEYIEKRFQNLEDQIVGLQDVKM